MLLLLINTSYRPPPDSGRYSQGSKTGTDRTRHNDGALLEQAGRRVGVDRHVSRNSASTLRQLVTPPFNG